ncbi:MAG: tRNA (adenosine(37)-N6)-threonylcarbamoyltransferase complex ATPase subunit type 1 TsaE [Dehalococcoidia bacterium]|nr:tRNA (adenosine(37)-N6)-threonylcarbamoyltransferase complex ATPase subunit type 1 TsaE [Dehalococcoidia bacterium]
MGPLSPMSTPLRLITTSPEGTQEVGRALGTAARAGDVFLLSGGLGVGKTCLTQGIAWGVGVQEHARSPTFVLVTEYRGRLPVYHMDLYRIDHLNEVLDLGLDEYLFGQGVCVIEWAEKAPEAFPADHVSVQMEEEGETQRVLEVTTHGQRSSQLLARCEGALAQAHRTEDTRG